jgi:F-type H+-transporting ATPase subunit delta
MSVAQDQNLGEVFAQEISSLLELLENSPELQEFIGNPVVKPEAKKAVMQRVMGDNSPSYLRNFLNLLVDKRRIPFVKDIGEQYLALWRKLTNTVLAEAISVQELSENQQQAVKEKVKSLTGAQTVELKTSLDPDLIGGVIIKVGSQIYDASLRNQLRQIVLSLM